MIFIDQNTTNYWEQTTFNGLINGLTVQEVGIARNSTDINSLKYVTGVPSINLTYKQNKNYQVVTTVYGDNSTNSSFYIKFNAPFKNSVAMVTRGSIDTSQYVYYYTYISPITTQQSNYTVLYGATGNSTLITSSEINEIDFYINGAKEFLYGATDSIYQPSGWDYSNSAYNWSFSGASLVTPTYSTFGSGLDTVYNNNFIAAYINYDSFNLGLSYSKINGAVDECINVYLVKQNKLNSFNDWVFIDSLSSSSYSKENLTGTNEDGSKNYLVLSASYSNTPTSLFVASLTNINIVGGYNSHNNTQYITTTSSVYSDPTPIGLTISDATYIFNKVVNGLSYSISGKVGNGLFQAGIWENGVWNNGWRDDTSVRDFDDIAFSIQTYSDVSWMLQFKGTTSSAQFFKIGDKVSIGNIIAIDINDNRKLLRDYYKVSDVGTVSNVDGSLSGYINVNLDTTFPYRRIEKDSQNHKIKITKNVWLSGGFFNGYFSGVWNNGLFKGYPLITEMFNTHWIDGFFNGGHFNSNYPGSDLLLKFYDLNPRVQCTNGYIQLTFNTTTGLVAGDYIIITIDPMFSNKIGVYGGVAQIVSVDSTPNGDIITINKIYNNNYNISNTSGTNLGYVIRYTATGLIQNFKFYDNNISKLKSTDTPISQGVFSYNSWIDVNYDNTRSVTLGRDFKEFEPITKKSISRNNLFGYPTYDVLSSASLFRDSNTLNSKLYKLGTKYKIYKNFIGDYSQFNEPFNDTDFTGFIEGGWTYSSVSLDNFKLKRSEDLIATNDSSSLSYINSGVTGDELYISATSSGLILNNNNVSILKSRYSVVEFDVVTYSVTNYNYSYNNPDIYQINSISGLGTFNKLNSSSTEITSTYSISTTLTPAIVDIVVMINLYSNISTSVINLKAPNGNIINLKRGGSGLGGRLSETKFSLRDNYTKFSSVTTPYSLNNTSVAYNDTYQMDNEIGQPLVGGSFVSNVNNIPGLTSSINGIWELYIKCDSTTTTDLTNWSINLVYEDLVSLNTDPVNDFPILHFSNLNYNVSTLVSSYDSLQTYKKMTYLPIQDNINHLLTKNTFRLDSIEDTTPTRGGGFGTNKITKKYEYFYNKTDLMMNVTGNGATGASSSMVIIDNLNMYEVDMIPFFKYFNDINIYKGIQIPYIGQAPNIDSLNSDFVFVDNITIGLDTIDDNAIPSGGGSASCQIVVLNDALTVTIVGLVNNIVISQTNYVITALVNIVFETVVTWSITPIVDGTFNPASTGNLTLTPSQGTLNHNEFYEQIEGLVAGGRYNVTVTATNNNSIASVTTALIVNNQVQPPSIIFTVTSPLSKDINYDRNESGVNSAKYFTTSNLIANLSNNVPNATTTSIKITAIPTRGQLSYNNTLVNVNDIIQYSDLSLNKFAYYPQNIGQTDITGGNFTNTFKYKVVDSLGNQSNEVTFTLNCTDVTVNNPIISIPGGSPHVGSGATSPVYAAFIINVSTQTSLRLRVYPTGGVGSITATWFFTINGVSQQQTLTRSGAQGQGFSPYIIFPASISAYQGTIQLVSNNGGEGGADIVYYPN